MKNYFIPGLIFICCIFAACNQTGTPVEYARACDADNDKKYVEVSGYLDDMYSVTCRPNTSSDPVTCSYELLESPGAQHGIRADIELGNGANNVEKLQSGYKKEDVKVHDNSGNIIKLTDRVKLVGKMYVTKNSNPGYNDVCFITVTKIEKQ
jgi:hypothetical protein